MDVEAVYVVILAGERDRVSESTFGGSNVNIGKSVIDSAWRLFFFPFSHALHVPLILLAGFLVCVCLFASGTCRFLHNTTDAMMNSGYKPSFGPEIESLIERIHPPGVCIDNETCTDCTLVKVDSANRHGILLDMVQVLTDLDLIISKSYICSDGGWFMDVFHVTDQHGNKIRNEHLIHYIQQALCAGKKGAKAKAKAKTYLGNMVGPSHVPVEQLNTMEMTVTDRPGLLSEVSAVLVALGFSVVSAAAWTHNTRAACIMYMEDESTGGAVRDVKRLAYAEEQLENVVGIHHCRGERRGVRLSGPEVGRIHTEQRLHQLMYADRDYDVCVGSRRSSCGARVLIESCNERGYSVVNVRSRDRPKLLFDTVCTLTDMGYVVFHAAISSHGGVAVQEYYIRHVDGCVLDTDGEKERVIKCLEASIERRVSHGLRLDLCTQNRVGLLSDITRLLREHSMSLSRADLGTHGDEAVGSFYVTDSSGNNVDLKTVESVRNAIGKNILKVNKCDGDTGSVEDGTPTPTPKSSLGSIIGAFFKQS